MSTFVWLLSVKKVESGCPSTISGSQSSQH